MDLITTPNVLKVETAPFSFQNGASGSSVSFYKYGKLVWGNINIDLPDNLSSGWTTFVNISAPPTNNVYGRTTTRDVSPARDWTIGLDENFHIYVVVEDSGRTLYLSVTYLTN